MLTPQQRVQAKYETVCKLAQSVYGVDLSKVPLLFNLTGRVAGWAEWKDVSGSDAYRVRINNEMINRGDEGLLERTINDVVPHEVAHIVCFMKPRLGTGHDQGWREVCINLGGTGARLHDEDVVMAKGNTYEYTTDRGIKVQVGNKDHFKIQQGASLRWGGGKGKVFRGCSYVVTAMDGQLLDAPIAEELLPPKHVVPFDELNSPGVLREQFAIARALLGVPTVQFNPGVTAPAVARRVDITAPQPGESKASISRRIMKKFFDEKLGYEATIAEMMRVNGYDRQLARGTYKANAPKIGLPQMH